MVRIENCLCWMPTNSLMHSLIITFHKCMRMRKYCDNWNWWACALSRCVWCLASVWVCVRVTVFAHLHRIRVFWLFRIKVRNCWHVPKRASSINDHLYWLSPSWSGVLWLELKRGEQIEGSHNVTEGQTHADKLINSDSNQVPIDFRRACANLFLHIMFHDQLEWYDARHTMRCNENQ